MGRRLFVVVLLGAALLVGASGCGYVAGLAISVASTLGGGSSGSGPVNANTQAAVVDLPTPDAQVQKVVVEVTDAESDPVALQLEYRLGDGAFQPANLQDVYLAGAAEPLPRGGAAASETPELATAPDGKRYELWWRWSDDLSAQARADVSLRLSVVGTIAGSSGGVAFTSDRVKIGNEKPVVSQVVAHANAGLIQVTYHLFDSTGDRSRLDAFYVVDGVTKGLTALDPAALLDVPASTTTTPSATSTFRFVWDSEKDISQQNAQGVLKLVAFDGQLESDPALAAFSVRNDQNEPPQAVISPLGRVVSGTVSVVYDLFDREGNATDLAARFALVDGTASGTALEVTGAGSDGLVGLSTSAGGTRHVFVWNAQTDLGPGAHDVRFRIEPQGTGAIADEARFLVGNDAPVATVSSSPSGPQSGDITVFYTLSDSTGDLASVTWEVATDGGGTFVTAASQSAIDFLATDDGAGRPVDHTFIWQSAANLPDAFDQAVTLRVRPTDGLAGGLGAYVTTTLTVTNGTGGGGGLQIPSVATQTPTRVATGSLAVAFTLGDPLDRLVDVAADVRLATSTIWATVSTSSPLAGLSSAAGSATHTVFWDFSGQLGGGAHRVVVRLTPTASSTVGAAAFTAPFWVGNDAPVLTATSSLAGTQRGLVVVPFFVMDSSADPVSVTVEVATSSGSFLPATPIASATTSLASQDPQDPQKPYAHTFLWDAPTDLAGYAGAVTLRLTPSDAYATGAATTIAATIDLNHAPSVQVAAPPREVVGPVSLPFTLTDPEADPVDVAASWRLTTSTSGWTAVSTTPPLSGLTGLAASSTGSSHTLEWDFATQLPAGAHRVVVRLTPTDAKGKSGSFAETAAFLVGNDPPVATVTTSLSGTWSGDVPLAYTLFDSSADPASVVVEYATSTDPGAIFHTAASPSSTSGLSTDDGAGGPVAHGFLWQSAVDLPDAAAQAVVLRLRPDDGFVGGQGAAVTTTLIVTNASGGGGGGGTPPGAVIVPAPARSVSSSVPVTVTVAAGTTDLWVFYAVDPAGTWFPATLSGTTTGTLDSGLTHHIQNLSGTATTTLTVTWNSFADFGAPHVGVRLRFRPSNASGDGPTTDYGPVTVGDTAPTVQWVSPTGVTVKGTVLLELRLTDAESDPLDLALRYDTGAASSSLHLLGVAATTTLATAPGGRIVTYAWDSIADLGAVKTTGVTLIATPDDHDPWTLEAPASSVVITVANGATAGGNKAPAVVIDEPAESAEKHTPFVLSYTLFDADGDAVDLVWQWAEEGQAFPDPNAYGDLANATTRASVVASSTKRHALHILTEHKVALEGAVQPSAGRAFYGDTSLQLRTSLAQHRLLDPNLSGMTLELEQTATFSLLATLSGTPGPVVIEAGEVYALVGVGGAVEERLLLDGSVHRSWTSLGVGTVTGLALEADGQHVLITGGGGPSDPVLSRLDLKATPTSVSTVLDAAGSRVPVAVAALPGGAALVVDTVSSSLGLVATDTLGVGFWANVATGLQTPRGVVVTPDGRTAYVAEHGASPTSTLLAIDLKTRARRVVSTDQPLTGASWLAIRPDGHRLLVATDEGAGASRVLEVTLPGGQVAVLGTGLSAPAGLAVDPGPVSRWSSAGEKALYTSAQRRVVASGLAGPARLEVGPAFAPAPRPGQRWRLLRGRNESMLSLKASPTGEHHTFCWDAVADGADGLAVRLRAIPYDRAAGRAGETRFAVTLSPRRTDPASFSRPNSKQMEPDNASGTSSDAGRDPIPAVSVGDLDGDGLLDVVWAVDHTAASGKADALTVSYQTSSQTFAKYGDTVVTTTPTTAVTDFVTGDVDGDGRLDAVIADREGNQLVVLLQQSHLVFTPVSVTSTAMTCPSAIALADLDGDGLLDLVSGNDGPATGTSTVAVFRQTTPGGFVLDRTLSLSDRQGWQQIEVGDVDGDGDLDIVGRSTTTLGASVLQEFLQNGSGPWIWRRTYGLLFDRFALGDVNHDGYCDLATVQVPGNWVRVYRGQAGAFDLSAPWVSAQALLDNAIFTSVVGELRDIAIGDVDRNGLPDLAVQKTDGTIQVLRQLRPGVFDTNWAARYQLAGSANGKSSKVYPGRTHTPLLFDVDRNGFLDLVWTGWRWSGKRHAFAISWWPGTYPFDYTAHTELRGTPTSPMTAPAAVEAVDVDGDGDLDVVTANRVSGTLLVFHQETAGAFDKRTGERVDLRGAPAAMAIGDVDQDGDPDVVLGGPDGVEVLLRGQGGFATTSWTFAGTSSTVSLALSDLQSDGDLDLVVATVTGTASTVHVFKGTGSGLGTTPWQSLAVGNLAAVALGDLDGDGLADLVATRGSTSGAGQVAIYRQDQAATSTGSTAAPFFSSTWQTATTTAFDPARLLLVDIDADGREDIVCTNAYPDTSGNKSVVIFLQRARGVFSTVRLTEPGSTKPSLYSVAVGDIDGDGRLDVAWGTQKFVRFIPQVSPGVFDASLMHTLYNSGKLDRVVGLSLVDLDGDGTIEVLTASENKDKAIIFYRFP